MKTSIGQLRKLVTEAISREKAVQLQRDARTIARSAMIDKGLDDRSKGRVNSKLLRASKMYAMAADAFVALGDVERSQECAYEAESLARDASR